MADFTALYAVPKPGECTEQIEMMLDGAKITLVFDKAAENPDVLKRIEQTLTYSCDLNSEKISA